MIAVEYNALLSSALEPFRNDPTMDLIEIDAFSYFTSIFTSPEKFGITNTSDPCVDLDIVCSNPNEFLFYDGLHPTVTFHQQFGEFVASQVTVPEPSSTIGICIATGMGLLFSKRKIFQ
ncbi:lipolytic enzyme, G-D-S-L [Crocosphaera chwakensis CCY0110]|uniref:Lipolytic enzyme, G-D-S-L n=2 Tax=Crocosphaera TaxID=263510 RepID=A3II91_9CHRO|nr:lipolytic enzyme, G-D-S-L [Crocosphaera chwakensis CCY0110]